MPTTQSVEVIDERSRAFGNRFDRLFDGESVATGVELQFGPYIETTDGHLRPLTAHSDGPDPAKVPAGAVPFIVDGYLAAYHTDEGGLRVECRAHDNRVLERYPFAAGDTEYALNLAKQIYACSPALKPMAANQRCWNFFADLHSDPQGQYTVRKFGHDIQPGEGEPIARFTRHGDAKMFCELADRAKIDSVALYEVMPVYERPLPAGNHNLDERLDEASRYVSRQIDAIVAEIRGTEARADDVDDAVGQALDHWFPETERGSSDWNMHYLEQIVEMMVDRDIASDDCTPACRQRLQAYVVDNTPEPRQVTVAPPPSGPAEVEDHAPRPGA